MIGTLKLSAVALGALTFVAAGTAQAQNKCQGEKIKAAGKKANCKLGLESKQAGKGGTIDPAKVAKCEAKLSSAFAKQEAKGGCTTTGDAAAIEAKVDAFVADIDTDLEVGTLPNKCQGEKIKAAGKKAECKLGLESKQASKGGTIDPAKVAKCEAKLSSAFAKQEAGGACNTTGDAAAIEAKVDAFVADVDDEINVVACCAGVQMSTVTSAGTLVVDSLNAFPFPAGVTTTMNVDAPDSECAHPLSVGVYDVPTFCIVGLGFSSDVFYIGCESGTALGNGTVWDGNASCPDADITRRADTSDGVCNPGGEPCNTGGGGAGANTLGDIDATRGNGACDAAGLQLRYDVPVRSLTWSDGDGTPDCPDEDGLYDSGTDNTITDFNFILSPTTASTRAQFVDKNADNCSFAGGGPASTRICSNDSSRPCSFNVDCDAPGTCAGGALLGVPAPGPCCTVGHASTMVATGAAFSGAGPLFDLIFMNRSPTTVTTCAAAQPLQTCTLTTDPCED
jgi:hypothetical protein